MIQEEHKAPDGLVNGEPDAAARLMPRSVAVRASTRPLSSIRLHFSNLSCLTSCLECFRSGTVSVLCGDFVLFFCTKGRPIVLQVIVHFHKLPPAVTPPPVIQREPFTSRSRSRPASCPRRYCCCPSRHCFPNSASRGWCRLCQCCCRSHPDRVCEQGGWSGCATWT
ncbi:uncharacterized protein B0I36DRAFT_92646 [Microdochium trichocladiopsis]|uniref:Uncharacterized protein n=1 Tax=Microdochium trichocladiopsis TaxID=1682393 RepID=A0A9P8YEF4_9PEZI|nr:uncharacterized protein B0I36DRAFT_92646 [Microdochium trichocladiopsis]KAH7035441.1 hypothetical protein B0I36DRAFT_92646 [Microdochium trichocladiopsis]